MQQIGSSTDLQVCAKQTSGEAVLKKEGPTALHYPAQTWRSVLLPEVKE